MRNPFKHWYEAGRDVRELARESGADVPDEALFSVVEDESAEERLRARAEEIAKLESRQQELEAKLLEAREATFAADALRMQGESAAYADGLLSGNKILPAERESLIATLVQAAMDDARFGTVSFSTGGSGSRVEQIKALYTARPAHTYTQEQLKVLAVGGTVQFNNAGEQDEAQRERDARLKKMREALGLPQPEATGKN